MSLLFLKLLELAIFSSNFFLSLSLSENTIFIPNCAFFPPLSVLRLSCLSVPSFLEDAHFPKAELTLTESCHSCQRLLSLIASEQDQI